MFRLALRRRYWTKVQWPPRRCKPKTLQAAGPDKVCDSSSVRLRLASSSHICIRITSECATTHARTSRQPLIAVVGDDEDLNRAIESTLNAAGFARSMHLSAESVLRLGVPPATACLVLDVHLPGISGFELHDCLASTTPRPPDVFMTAHDAPAARARSQRAGAGCISRQALRRESPDWDIAPSVPRRVTAGRARWAELAPGQRRVHASREGHISPRCPLVQYLDPSHQKTMPC